MRKTAILLLAFLFCHALDARQPVRALHTMVVTREAHATDVGERVLRAGGNAIDAAVAVGFALAVTHPSAGNLGGGGFMLIRFADGRDTFIDFRERGSASASRDMYLDAAGKATDESLIGYRASAVPGTVRGLEYAYKKYGRAKWKDLVNPAVELASGGFRVSWGLAQALRSEAVSAKLEMFPESKRIFLKGGAFYEMGDTLAQPELARTLARIRDRGAADFYSGETARLLAADMAAHRGLITLRDLKDYKAIERRPLEGDYRGYHIVTAPPPSSGGVGILQMLGVLEGTDYFKAGAGSAAELHMLAETMRRFFADRSEYLGDPDFVHVPVRSLLNSAYIGELRRSIDPAHATPSAEVHPGKLAVSESTQTTHFSIVDAEGNAVAMTYTLNGGFGSGVTAAKLGFLLNNEMDDFAPKPGEANNYGLIQGEANAIAPHKTPLSSMTPTIVLDDGKLFLVTGTPGGPTIINTVLETIVNAIDFHMNAQEIVDQPRIHHQWMPDELRVEESLSPDTVRLLEAMGHRIQRVGAIGEAAVILRRGKWLEGASDGRTEGTAKGY